MPRFWKHHQTVSKISKRKCDWSRPHRRRDALLADKPDQFLNKELQESVALQGIECLGKVRLNKQGITRKERTGLCRIAEGCTNNAFGRPCPGTGPKQEEGTHHVATSLAVAKRAASLRKNFTTHNGAEVSSIVHTCFLGDQEDPARGQLSIG